MERPISLNDVIAACESLLGNERMGLIRSGNRVRATCRARAAACYACRLVPSYEPSLADIGAVLRLNASTVLVCVESFSQSGCRDRWRDLVTRYVNGQPALSSEAIEIVTAIEEGRDE